MIVGLTLFSFSRGSQRHIVCFPASEGSYFTYFVQFLVVYSGNASLVEVEMLPTLPVILMQWVWNDVWHFIHEFVYMIFTYLYFSAFQCGWMSFHVYWSFMFHVPFSIVLSFSYWFMDVLLCILDASPELVIKWNVL